MSGAISIKIPPKINVSINVSYIEITGLKGTKIVPKHPSFFCTLSNNGSLLLCELSQKNKKLKNNNLEKKFLLFITLLKNSIKGTFKGFFTELKLQGVGYRFLSYNNHLLKFKVGFCNDLAFKINKEVEVILESPTKISLFSHDYELLKQTSSTLKSFKKPDSYKGKGFSYVGEVLSLKEVKKG